MRTAATFPSVALSARPRDFRRLRRASGRGVDSAAHFRSLRPRLRLCASVLWATFPRRWQVWKPPSPASLSGPKRPWPHPTSAGHASGSHRKRTPPGRRLRAANGGGGRRCGGVGSGRRAARSECPCEAHGDRGRDVVFRHTVTVSGQRSTSSLRIRSSSPGVTDTCAPATAPGCA